MDVQDREIHCNNMQPSLTKLKEYGEKMTRLKEHFKTVT